MTDYADDGRYETMRGQTSQFTGVAFFFSNREVTGWNLGSETCSPDRIFRRFLL
jgi:hypothetical protein